MPPRIFCVPQQSDFSLSLSFSSLCVCVCVYTDSTQDCQPFRMGDNRQKDRGIIGQISRHTMFGVYTHKDIDRLDTTIKDRFCPIDNRR